ncbi:hypothetical protein LTR36_007955 [Oleoguttula mirabilis]|uniref:Glycosyltransferase family 28 N-terminal domain-containing protein n=1 Tax=Oleoguttula mirabilis TaxID=1507867 RepID=A0AAV9J8T1_9PEZI|nr:hypothetical protein LTR36_007955 [Oleoguttula mirabilis]
MEPGQAVEAMDRRRSPASADGTGSSPGSYFDQQMSTTDGAGELQSTSRVPAQQEALSFTPAQATASKRAITAPMEPGLRPRAGPRASTLLGGMKRRTTGADVSSNNTRPYAYTFDPLSSDSSSSEDEKPTERDQPVKTSKRTRKPQQTDTTDFAQEQERKKREKKGHSYTRFALGDENLRSKGRVSKRDGRLNISVNETANSGYVAKALGQSIKHHLDVPRRTGSRLRQRQDRAVEDDADAHADSIASSLRQTATRPRLNIVIMVIGSRGDIQPFLKVGKILQEHYGHRVRIATHPTFRDFVQNQNGLEFFSIGGDPAELMAFMVKNPGLIPKLQTIREGEIQKRRTSMAEMFEGFWRACISTTDDEKDKDNLKMLGDKSPFIADAIIANPPSMAHVHIAEKLGVPLHMMFTFPYSPTQQFPHPVANIKPQRSNVDAKYVNFMSYPLVEMMTWQGLGDIVNRFRERTLGLEPVSSLWAPGALYRMKVPYTYLWSPALVPKPKDWGPEIDIAGFVFLDLASKFKPEKDLQDFLNAGGPPVYVGFGSIVVDDPNALTDMIFDAAKMAGVRVLVNKGWGGLGRDSANTPDYVFMLGNTPHDWLFPRVKAVVHHGGAGTTAIGLKCGKPTMIVPFFGDQPFWGAMVAAAKAGAHQCIPYKNMTVERFAEGIKQCLTEEAQINVQKIADSIAREGDGAENAVKSFHRSLPLAGKPNMRCSMLEDRVSVWKLRNSSLRLSALAAELLHETGKIKWHDLKLLRHHEWNDFDGPGEPITGTVGAVTDSLYGIGGGVGMVPVRIARHIRKHEEHHKKKQAVQRRKEEKKQRRATQAGGKAGVQTVLDSAKDNSNTQSAPVGEQRPHAARENTTATVGSTISADPSEPLPKELAGDVGHGLKRSGAALITAPNNLHVAIAQGFHNAPRLWGDATVRKPVRITGFKSGLVAARKEFTYGIYDGWTGLVTQPVGGWKDGDTVPAKFAGLGVGVGKGAGGFVLKNISAVVGSPAYFGKGIVKYVEKRFEGPGTKSFVRRARIIQGQRDVREFQGKEQELRQVRARVGEGWKVYEEIWHSAHHQFSPTGENLVGRLKFSREKRSWDVNGALENVDTANRALGAHKHGHDVEKLFAKRRRDMREAEKPRVGVLEQPDRAEEKRDVLPNGHEVDTRHVKGRDDKADMGAREAQREEEMHSDSTAVATNEEDAEHNDSHAEHVKVKGNYGSLRLNAEMANRRLTSVG